MNDFFPKQATAPGSSYAAVWSVNVYTLWWLPPGARWCNDAKVTSMVKEMQTVLDGALRMSPARGSPIISFFIPNY